MLARLYSRRQPLPGAGRFRCVLLERRGLVNDRASTEKPTGALLVHLVQERRSRQSPVHGDITRIGVYLLLPPLTWLS